MIQDALQIIGGLCAWSVLLTAAIGLIWAGVSMDWHIALSTLFIVTGEGCLTFGIMFIETCVDRVKKKGSSQL